MIALRRALRATSGVWAGLLACSVIASGVLDESSPFHSQEPTLVSALVVAAVLAVLIGAIARRVQHVEPSARAQRISTWLRLAGTFADLEVALAMCAAMYALIAVTGGLSSPLYPMLYAIIAFSVTFQRGLAVIGCLAAVAALELASWYRQGAVETSLLLIHSGFIVAACVVHAVFLRGMVALHRSKHRAQIDAELRQRRESARDYRLISVALGADSRGQRTRREEEEFLQAGSVETIASSVYHSLLLLQQSLSARSCVLLWVADGGKSLKLKEAVSDGDELLEANKFANAGLVNAVIRDRKVLRMNDTKAGQLPYYSRGFVAGAFLGVPICDGPYLRGVLCVDRKLPMGDVEQELCERAAEQVSRAIRSEQLFGAMERAKYEHERFYHASALLCRALTMEQVQETAFDAALAIVEYDLAVITLHDSQKKRHRVLSTREREGARPVADVSKLRELEFRDNSGLASMVVKNKHYLPQGGTRRDQATPIFTSKLKFQCESLLVLPLISADEAIGTLTLASHKGEQFRKDTREMLGVICNQVAVSMQNALMYKRMETMATTDGLTGLTNHRSFQERFAELLERSERHGHKAAMLLCDVDHFKSVNDSYGHPVGDEVLRQVAKVLQDATRKIDIPARYGGEEFAVVLEATDLEGALGLAERIREDVGNLVLDHEGGTFQITMSIGVASFPADGNEPAVLIERADMSLYHAKESGRNQVVCYRDFLAARDRQAS